MDHDVAAQRTASHHADMHKIIGFGFRGCKALLEKAPAGMTGMISINRDHPIDIIGAEDTRSIKMRRANPLHAYASTVLDIIFIKARFGVGIHDLVEQRQKRHFFLLNMREHPLTQFEPDTPEFGPSRLIESLAGCFASKRRELQAQWPHRLVLGRQVGADCIVASRFEIGKKLFFFEIEVTLDFGLNPRRQIGQELRHSSIFPVRHARAMSRHQLLKPLHERNGGPMLFVQNLTDAIGKVHGHAWS
jgi:hypothetical protein